MLKQNFLFRSYKFKFLCYIFFYMKSLTASIQKMLNLQCCFVQYILNSRRGVLLFQSQIEYLKLTKMKRNAIYLTECPMEIFINCFNRDLDGWSKYFHVIWCINIVTSIRNETSLGEKPFDLIMVWKLICSFLLFTLFQAWGFIRDLTWYLKVILHVVCLCISLGFDFTWIKFLSTAFD